MELVGHPLVAGPGKRAGLFWLPLIYSPVLRSGGGLPVHSYLDRPGGNLRADLGSLPDHSLHSLSDAENTQSAPFPRPAVPRPSDNPHNGRHRLPRLETFLISLPQSFRQRAMSAPRRGNSARPIAPLPNGQRKLPASGEIDNTKRVIGPHEEAFCVRTPVSLLGRLTPGRGAFRIHASNCNCITIPGVEGPEEHELHRSPLI